MKTLIKINHAKEEINMTKATAKKASIIGTDEYRQLVEVKRDLPNYTVVIVSPKGKENSNKGLTLPLMETLIKAMSNDNQAAIEGFDKVRNYYQNSNFHFSKPKEYFVSHYPDWREWLPKIDERQEAQNLTVEKVEVEERWRKMGFDAQYNIS